MRSPSPSRPAGFTLVEILVVMAVVGIVAAVAVPQILAARERSRVAACDGAFHALDGEIANELEVALASPDGHPSCGDINTAFVDLAILRCLATRFADDRNPRNRTQRLYFNYVENPIPFDSCQVGLDESDAETQLSIRVRQVTSESSGERTFVIQLQ